MTFLSQTHAHDFHSKLRCDKNALTINLCPVITNFIPWIYLQQQVDLQKIRSQNNRLLIISKHAYFNLVSLITWNSTEIVSIASSLWCKLTIGDVMMFIFTTKPPYLNIRKQPFSFLKKELISHAYDTYETDFTTFRCCCPCMVLYVKLEPIHVKIKLITLIFEKD